MQRRTATVEFDDDAARKVFGNKTYHKADAGIMSKRVEPNGGTGARYTPLTIK